MLRKNNNFSGSLPDMAFIGDGSTGNGGGGFPQSGEPNGPQIVRPWQIPVPSRWGLKLPRWTYYLLLVGGSAFSLDSLPWLAAH